MKQVLAFLKKYLTLAITGAVTLLLLVLVVWQLLGTARRYREETGALQAALGRLQQLHAGAPFPSEANVARETRAGDEMLDGFNEINAHLRAAQIEPQAMEAADFMPLLETTLARMQVAFTNAQIALPQKYAFGFERYAVGKLPHPDDIPRLVQQMRIMERLCQILIEAGISGLEAATRQEFDSAPRAAPPSGRAPPPPPRGPAGPSPIYTNQYFTFAFKAREAVVFDVLNRLSTHPMFCVVTTLELNNQRADAKSRAPAPEAGRGGGGAAPPSSAKERSIIVGKEEVAVKMGVNVYHFEPSLPSRWGSKARP